MTEEERRRPKAQRRPAGERTPVQQALGMLVRREHSRKELARKLASRGIDAGAAAAAVDRLAQDGWQDDSRFAEMLARSRAGNGYGPVRIRAELATHGLEQDAIRQVLGDLDGGWAETARDLVRRRYGPAAVDDPAVRRKAADFLLRRGFAAEHIRAAVSEDIEE
ncbi:regulatory protein RecX [Luteimonas aquatica]|uniref:regulatory protein RecX n=1 Tax=Luteimonas aquatica TaxID=450364 RepID=UPI001F59F81D|nr:regulatory protein RecX [Luteimonas aquatica]